MTITEQIQDFAAFAQQLAEQQGEELTLDEVYQQWKEIDRFFAFEVKGNRTFQQKTSLTDNSCSTSAEISC